MKLILPESNESEKVKKSKNFIERKIKIKCRKIISP